MIDRLTSGSYLVEWLPELWFWLLFSVVGIYFVLDGFDFGVGILYGTRSSESHRETLHSAFGPVWKANEVWLVLFGNVLFAAYPSVYANLLSRQYPLVFVLLLGLILRGTGAKLRTERDDERWKRYWDYAFVTGSTIAPFALGVFLMRWVFVGTSVGVDILGGLVVLSLFVVLGATFLVAKTTESLQADIKAYGQLAVGFYTLGFVTLGALLTGGGAVRFRVFIAAAGTALLFALASVIALRLDRPYAAFGSAVMLTGVFVGFVALGLYPMIDPAANLGLRDAVVSPISLNMLTVVAAVFLPMILAGFGMLYSIFSGSPSEGQY